MRRSWIIVTGPLVMLVLAAVAAVLLVGRSDTALQTTVIQSGLEIPWDLDFTPDGRMIVSERPGRLRVYSSAEPGAPLLQTLPVADIRAEGEAGAMGVAVDSAFPSQPFIYLCASLDADGEAGSAPWHNVILRFRFETGGAGELRPNGVIFEESMVAAIHHNGCALEMDAQRHLWFTMGDGNVPAASVNPAQDPLSLNGKVLRINADGSIPADNPLYPGAAGPTAVWSMGHRNPQGLAFAVNGDLYVAEHGTDTDDEINRIQPGGNYGYACWTNAEHPGPAQDGPAGGQCADASAYRAAAWASGTPTIAISGARFVVGDAWRGLEGSLLVATLKEGDLRRFAVRDSGARVVQEEILLDGAFGRLRGVVHGPGGAIYLTTSNGVDDMVVRVTPAG
jgi:glucose/arabinose dehydrogenase